MIGGAAIAYGFLIGLVLAATGLPVAPGALTMQAVVNSGHRGAVLDIAQDAARGLLFSAGEDGTLRVWDAESRKLLRRISITRRVTRSVSLDPAGSRAAVVIADQVRSSAIEVWDWSATRLVARIPLDAEPLFVRFSQTGTYLLCGETEWQGLRIFRASDGSPVPFHPEGFGMVGFAETSKNDMTLLTYQPSGKIAYWDLASGSLLVEREARAGLSGIRISDDRRWLTGTDGDSVAAIDALTGELRYEFSEPGLLSMDASGDGTRIACLSRNGGLRLWSFSAGSLSSRPVALGPDRYPRTVRWSTTGVLLGGPDGELDAVDETGAETAFARDEISKVSGIALGNGILALATTHSIHMFSYPPSGITHSAIPNPYGGPVGLDFVGTGKLLAWRLGDGPGALGVVDLSTGTFSDSGVRLTAPIVAEATRDGRVATLEEGGIVKVSDLATGALQFETRRPGVTAIAMTGPHTLLCGRAEGGALGSSLMRIDTRTGETAPVPCASRLTFSLITDPAHQAAYSLGVGPGGKTDLLQHSGPGLDSERVLDSAEGELLSASASLDREEGVLYAAFDQEMVGVSTGGVPARRALPIRGAVALRAANGILVSLGKDSLVSLWDAAAGRPLGDISLFSDDGWAVTFPDGSYAGSADLRNRVAVFLESRLRAAPWQLTNPPARLQSGTP
jgi:WD40 repeat protein